ncbi:MAG TPA: FG-GAP-like repeat-containing protein, partial [Thermoanaerobaculia bacterium]
MIRTANRHLTCLEPCNRLGLFLLLSAVAALSTPSLAAPLPPDRAARILSARNLGLAQLEEGRTKEARKTFDRLAELVPDDPLPWANGAIAALRDNDLGAAEKLLDRARKAGGNRPDLEALRAALEEAKNHPEEARAALGRAAALDPRDLESRWRLVRSIETLPAQNSPQKAARRKALAEISAASPANLPARLKLLLAGLEAADAATARKDLAEVRALLEDADPKTKQFLAEASAFVEKGDLRQGALKARILENLLRVTPRYQQSLAELQTNVVGMPMAAFAPALESALRPQGGAAIPLSFRVVATPAEDPAITLRRVDLKNTGKPEVYAIPAPFTGAAFFDFDLDGDLDVYLYGGGRADRLLRNNLDGTWADVTGGTGDPEFASRDVVVGDFDRDGDLDLAAIDAKGDVVLRSNLRQGRFRTIALGVKGALALAADDLNADGAMDLVVLTKEGVVVLVNKGDGTFVREESGDLARVAELSPRSIVLADLDNDGFPDLVVSGEKGMAAFRRAGPAAFRAWSILPGGVLPASRMIALDVDHDG